MCVCVCVCACVYMHMSVTKLDVRHIRCIFVYVIDGCSECIVCFVNMHHRLGSVNLVQLAFPGEGNPNFPWEKSHLDSKVVKS